MSLIDFLNSFWLFMAGALLAWFCWLVFRLWKDGLSEPFWLCVIEEEKFSELLSITALCYGAPSLLLNWEFILKVWIVFWENSKC